MRRPLPPTVGLAICSLHGPAAPPTIWLTTCFVFPREALPLLVRLSFILLPCTIALLHTHCRPPGPHAGPFPARVGLGRPGLPRQCAADRHHPALHPARRARARRHRRRRGRRARADALRARAAAHAPHPGGARTAVGAARLPAGLRANLAPCGRPGWRLAGVARAADR
eukprot:scaffold1889_cov108-Isochrysis_galbana.AAC.1